MRRFYPTRRGAFVSGQESGGSPAELIRDPGSDDAGGGERNDAKGEDRRQPAIQVGDRLTSRAAQKYRIRHASEQDASCYVENVVLLGEQRRQADQCGCADRCDADWAVHAGKGERRHERVRNVDRRETVERRIRAVEQSDP
ncbi:MAG TPA: hypothetical protein VMN81_05590 [Vicinamibacterales bacterium]|nr:hypothetical protein [Vicinamibacterales bacterium]